MASLLADLVLLLHLGFIAFAVLGALLVLRWRWALLGHVPALGWAVYIELTSGVCPLTPLENTLRRASGDVTYSSSFIEHYLIPVIYPSTLTPAAQSWLAIGLLLINIALYSYVVARRRRRARLAVQRPSGSPLSTGKDVA